MSRSEQALCLRVKLIYESLGRKGFSLRPNWGPLLITHPRRLTKPARSSRLLQRMLAPQGLSGKCLEVSELNIAFLPFSKWDLRPRVGSQASSCSVYLETSLCELPCEVAVHRNACTRLAYMACRTRSYALPFYN